MLNAPFLFFFAQNDLPVHDHTVLPSLQFSLLRTFLVLMQGNDTESRALVGAVGVHVSPALDGIGVGAAVAPGKGTHERNENRCKPAEGSMVSLRSPSVCVCMMVVEGESLTLHRQSQLVKHSLI